jgi:chemotaxis protein CheC
METQQVELWSSIIRGASAEGLLRTALRHVAYSLSDMVGRPFEVSSLRIETRPINRLETYANDPEAETVGIYLRSIDTLPGQTILILSLADAMYLADWLLELRPGTTTRLGSLEYSALAETGNLMLSSFLNAVAEFTGQPLRLSPPAVMVDMLATVFQAVAASVAEVTDDLFILETDFVNVDSSLLIRLWLLPDPAVLTLNQVKIN